MLRWLIIWTLVGVGCDDRSAPRGSGASHWLQPCVDDTQCGALACLCGQCSAACEVGNNGCPVGVCAADACGGAAVCAASAAMADEASMPDEDRSADDGSAEDRVVDDLPVDPAWTAGPSADGENPRGVWQFHQPSIIDGNVLELRADGTFVYTLGGCEAVQCAWGQWQSDVDGIRLLPPTDEGAFRWPDEFALHAVRTVVLSPTDEGVAARVEAADRLGYDQRWLNRGLSIDCVDWTAELSDAAAQAQHCRMPAYPNP